MTESAIEVASQPAAPRVDPAVSATAAPSHFRRRFSLFLRFLQSPAFAYAVILLLQLKVVWRAWDLRDLTPGDTSGYYVRTFTWYQDWLVNIVWSPLYLAFYGTLMHLSRDPFTVTMLHRLIIVFAATAGVLAVLRRMLPHWLALLVAAWWTVLPINFDTLYEVHLFALLPVLAAWLVILRRPRTAAGGEWCRSIALAILVLSTFLVRNETVVAVACLGLVCLVWEWRRWRLAKAAQDSAPQAPVKQSADAANSKLIPSDSSLPPPVPWLPTLLRYALPTFLVLLLVVAAYFRSFVRFHGYVLHGQPQPELGEVWHVKHTLNMAQVYAFGYQQRHPEWDKNPWTECGELSRRTFGRPDPTITDMLLHNPRATLEHFAWNFRLVPAGLQVLLFNSTSFQDNPDYAPVNIQPIVAVPLSLSALTAVAIGLGAPGLPLALLVGLLAPRPRLGMGGHARCGFDGPVHHPHPAAPPLVSVQLQRVADDDCRDEPVRHPAQPGGPLRPSPDAGEARPHADPCRRCAPVRSMPGSDFEAPAHHRTSPTP